MPEHRSVSRKSNEAAQGQTSGSVVCIASDMPATAPSLENPPGAVLDVQKPGQITDMASPSFEPSADSMRIVVIDDHAFTRECIANCLQSSYREARVTSFATAADCADGGIGREDIAVVLYNVRNRRVSAPDVNANLSMLLRLFPSVPIILLSDIDGAADYIVEALERGVRGYIPTSSTLSIALEAMRLVRAGGTFVPASGLLALSAQTASSAKAIGTGKFTPRQMAVLHQLRKGKANKTIAHELYMGESTVKVHIRNIMKKLKATNRTEAAFLARELMGNEDGD